MDRVRGKDWAYFDSARRRSKRQKGLSDSMRLVEAHPSLLEALLQEIRELVG